MSHPGRAQLELYALGVLTDVEREQIADAISRDSALQQEIDDIHQDLAALVDLLPPAPPPPRLKARLEGSIARLDALSRFAEPVAALLRDTADRARYLLRLLTDPDAWADMGGGCSLIHVRPSPALAAAYGGTVDVGFVRVDAGREFPLHRHLGHEEVLVLQGAMTDSGGRRAGPGDRVDMPGDTEHALWAGPGEPLIYLAVVGGVEIPGVELGELPPDKLR